VHLKITIQKQQKYFIQFQSLTMITQLELGITDGVSVSLVSINVWRLAGDTLNITCNFLRCNHQVHREFLITLYDVPQLPPLKNNTGCVKRRNEHDTKICGSPCILEM
jgi:hypothetical protein